MNSQKINKTTTLQKNERETLIKKMVLRPLCDGIRPSLCSDKGSTVFLGQQYQYSRGGSGDQGIEERGISQYSRAGGRRSEAPVLWPVLI